MGPILPLVQRPPASTDAALHTTHALTRTHARTHPVMHAACARVAVRVQYERDQGPVSRRRVKVFVLLVAEL